MLPLQVSRFSVKVGRALHILHLDQTPQGEAGLVGPPDLRLPFGDCVLDALFRVRSRVVSVGLTSRRLGRDKPDSETDDFSHQFLGFLTSCLRWTRTLQKENPGFTP